MKSHMSIQLGNKILFRQRYLAGPGLIHHRWARAWWAWAQPWEHVSPQVSWKGWLVWLVPCWSSSPCGSRRLARAAVEMRLRLSSALLFSPEGPRRWRVVDGPTGSRSHQTRVRRSSSYANSLLFSVSVSVWDLIAACAFLRLRLPLSLVIVLPFAPFTFPSFCCYYY
jgi:hypothetical protein